MPCPHAVPFPAFQCCTCYPLFSTEHWKTGNGPVDKASKIPLLNSSYVQTSISNIYKTQLHVYLFRVIALQAAARRQSIGDEESKPLSLWIISRHESLFFSILACWQFHMYMVCSSVTEQSLGSFSRNFHHWRIYMHITYSMQSRSMTSVCMHACFEDLWFMSLSFLHD